MLVPALYFTDQGQPMHKADSFEPFYSEFGEVSDCIREASDLRDEWGDLLGPAWSPFARFAYRLPRMSIRGALFFWRLSVLRERVEQQIEPRIAALLDQVRLRFTS